MYLILLFLLAEPIYCSEHFGEHGTKENGGQ